MGLDSRKDSILRAIVLDYVETAEPIGSEWLAARHDFGCKSATLRNEMADMSDRGLLLQPHTSAGRIPSDVGYRYFVDRLMTPVRVRHKPLNRTVPLDTLEVEGLVRTACHMLAELTQYPSVASRPTVRSCTLQRVFFSVAGPRRVLLVMLLSSGHVEHRLIEVDDTASDDVLLRFGNLLNEKLGGHDVTSVGRVSIGQVPSEIGLDQAMAGRLYGAVVKTARDMCEDHLFLEGTAHILRQREFQSVLRLERLLSVLEERSLLYQVFSSAMSSEEVVIRIGSETELNEVSGCSFIASAYRIRGHVGGFIGVFGPTRMRYSAASAHVARMAHNLSDVLTQSSLGG